jgi:hypothetical protein
LALSNQNQSSEFEHVEWRKVAVITTSALAMMNHDEFVG